MMNVERKGEALALPPAEFRLFMLEWKLFCVGMMAGA